MVMQNFTTPLFYCERYEKNIRTCFEVMTIREFKDSDYKHYPPPCKYFKDRKCTYVKKEKTVEKTVVDDKCRKQKTVK